MREPPHQRVGGARVPPVGGGIHGRQYLLALRHSFSVHRLVLQGEGHLVYIFERKHLMRGSWGFDSMSSRAGPGDMIVTRTRVSNLHGAQR